VKPRGPMDQVNAAVGDLAGALRRRREGREPHVRLYDADGHVHSLDPTDARADDLLDAAEAMVDATAARAETRK
jgi:hypothetical protein